MEAAPGRARFGSEWDCAVELADRVSAGRGLPVLPSPVLLDPVEVLHAEVVAYGWRFHGVDVVYEEPRAVGIGGPVVFALTALGIAAARRRVRAEAARLAVPQWRPLGHLRILATDQRLLVFYQGSWASVWYAGICVLRPALPEQRLEMLFEDDPPYALAGRWVPYLAVVLTTSLAQICGVDALADALT